MSLNKTPQPGPQRLYRRATDRVFLGVCAGLGDYFGIDPVLVRIAFVLFTLAGGAGVLAYLVLAIVMPVEPGTPMERRTYPPIGTQVVGALLVCLGLIFLAGSLGWMAWMNWNFVWPLVLIALGAAVLLRQGGWPQAGSPESESGRT